MSKNIDSLKRTLKSPKFVWAIVGLFLLQGTFFALAVEPSYPEHHQNGHITRGGGVVPDGNRHMGAIYYFAERPALTAPFINDQADRDLWMGDLERFPSYFYYYLLSFPVRASMALGAPDWVNILIVRFVGLLIGVLALWVFYRITRELKAGYVVSNLSALALAITGSFAYLSPAENYDILALAVFFLFVLSAIRLFARNDTTQAYWMAVWFLVGSITKYTYLPFMGVVGLMSLVIYLQTNGGWWLGWQVFFHQVKSRAVSLNKFLVGVYLIILVAAGGLFTERIVGNLVNYQSFNPSCVKIHSHEACMSFGVYQRNYNRATALEQGTAKTRYQYNPATYTPMWLNKYYTSMYAYVGHIWIGEFWRWMYVGLASLTIALIGMYSYLKVKRQTILENYQQKLVAATAGVFVVAQYLFNVRTYVNFEGMTYAHQGRYLLPAIGFLYVIIILVATKFIRTIPKSWRTVAVVVLTIVAVLVLVTNSALSVWFMHADHAGWYSQPFKFLAR